MTFLFETKRDDQVSLGEQCCTLLLIRHIHLEHLIDINKVKRKYNTNSR